MKVQTQTKYALSGNAFAAGACLAGGDEPAREGGRGMRVRNGGTRGGPRRVTRRHAPHLVG